MSPERKPLWDGEAEICVLGACLIDEEAIAKAAEIVQPDTFWKDAHRRIFDAVLRLFQRGEVVDPVTLSAELKAMGELERVGGMTYVVELLDAVPTAAAVEHHAAIVRDMAQLRRLRKAAEAIIGDVDHRDGMSAAEVLERAERRVFEVGQGQRAGKLEPVKKLLLPTLDAIEKRQVAKDGVTGTPSGFYDLDRMTGGFQAGNLIVLAARPSMGKTSAAIGCALHAAIERRIPVAMFSMEMSKKEIVERMLCHEAMVDVSHMIRGGLTDDEYVRLAQQSPLLNEAPIWIDDSGALTPLDIRSRLRRIMVDVPDLGLAVVDYIGMMRGEGENRTQEVGYISRGLKAVAKEFSIPVLALCQLSRAPDQRSDHRPILSDLRESGDLEQDADLVMFLYRPERYYGPTKDGEDLRGKAELILAKQRNGPTGTVHLYFRDYCARFEDAAPDYRSAP